jgi:uncharacterized protein
VIGAILNATGIIVGGIAGLVRKKPPPASTQYFFKTGLGAFTAFYGLRLVWISLNGPFLEILKQLGVIALALLLGKWTGHLLRLQKTSNQIGQLARQLIAVAKPGAPGNAGIGFKVCSALFCAAPLGILGAVADGLTPQGYFYPLAVKGVMDGLAAMGFVSIFGRGVLLSALPMFVFQGSLTLAAQILAPFLQEHDLAGPVTATAGLLVTCVAMLIFEIKKIELADYIPSLIFAPLLAWLILK